MTDALTALGLTLPWLAGIAWICRRGGLRVLFGDGEAFPSQADELPAFRGR